MASETHRLFVGLPIEPVDAEAIHEWAAHRYCPLPVRLSPPVHLHVTLLFYPAVSSEKRDWMAGFVREVEWSPLSVRTTRTARYGSALALDLQPARKELERLDDRLIRASSISDEYRYHDRL